MIKGPSEEISEIKKGFQKLKYICNDQIATAVYLAKALDKPIITLHDNKLNHALKEVNQAASASCRSVEQVVNILSYLIDGTLEKQSLNVAE